MLIKKYENTWFCNLFYRGQFPMFKKNIYRYWFISLDKNFICGIDLGNNKISFRFKDNVSFSYHTTFKLNVSKSNVQTEDDEYFDISYLDLYAQPNRFNTVKQISNEMFDEYEKKFDEDLDRLIKENHKKQQEEKEKQLKEEINLVLNQTEVIETRMEEFKEIVEKTFPYFKNTLVYRDGYYFISDECGYVCRYVEGREISFKNHINPDITVRYLSPEIIYNHIRKYVNSCIKTIKNNKEKSELLDKISEVLKGT